MSVNHATQTGLAAILAKSGSTLLSDWMKEIQATKKRGGQTLGEAELRRDCAEFIKLLEEAAEKDGENVESAAWSGVRTCLHLRGIGVQPVIPLPRQHHSSFLSRSRFSSYFAATWAATVRLWPTKPGLSAR